MNNIINDKKYSPFSEGMYFLFPLLFSQLVAIHIAIGIPPHVFFGLGIIFFYSSISKKHIIPIALFFLFLIASSFADSSIKQAIQISIEFFYGYLIARFFALRYSCYQLKIFFKNSILIWTFIIILFLFDFYFFGAVVNGLFENLTNWKAGGVTTYFTRISIIFGNPNWLSLFYLLIFSLYLHFGGKSTTLIIIAITTVFLLQTKTAIAIAFLLPVLAHYNRTTKIRTFSYITAFLASISILTYINWNKIYDFYLYTLELSSFVNREALFIFIEPYIKLYPNGLIGEGSKETLRSLSNEDSMPSFFLVLRLLGAPITILFVAYFLNPLKKINVVIFSLILMSVTQSFLSISGVCSLAFFSAFLSYFVSMDDNPKNDIYTR